MKCDKEKSLERRLIFDIHVYTRKAAESQCSSVIRKTRRLLQAVLSANMPQPCSEHVYFHTCVRFEYVYRYSLNNQCDGTATQEKETPQKTSAFVYLFIIFLRGFMFTVCSWSLGGARGAQASLWPLPV